VAATPESFGVVGAKKNAQGTNFGVSLQGAKKKERKMEQGKLWETESKDGNLPPEHSIFGKKYYEEKIFVEKYKKMKIENDLKIRQLDYKSDVDKAFIEIYDIILLFFQSFEEVVPIEALGKEIEESKKIHASAVGDCKKKINEALESYIKSKEKADA
jgi:hypothetical protein